jgi:hypothetical protein
MWEVDVKIHGIKKKRCKNMESVRKIHVGHDY